MKEAVTRRFVHKSLSEGMSRHVRRGVLWFLRRSSRCPTLRQPLERCTHMAEEPWRAPVIYHRPLDVVRAHAQEARHHLEGFPWGTIPVKTFPSQMLREGKSEVNRTPNES
ncbi:hypothetical protein NPIL_296961 [Nephila pilipes]|uniref:Uncharacterized protein n=1 Tax=Nephila pilipes TaxID=299642 RepID=A0A8X6U5R4_NEPPI|nr:hypothetical protein NPIL_296961 [Nephila pilipes]